MSSSYNIQHAYDTFGGHTDGDVFATELRNMVLAAEGGSGGGYEWDVYYVYWHTKRERFYVIGGSGCSCNWISDDVDSLGDFQDYATRGEVIAAFKREKEHTYGWSDADILSVVNDIRNFRV